MVGSAHMPGGQGSSPGATTHLLPTWTAALFLPGWNPQELVHEFLHCIPHQDILQMRKTEVQGHTGNGVKRPLGEGDA